MLETPGSSPKPKKVGTQVSAGGREGQTLVADAWNPIDLPDPEEREQMEHIDKALQKGRRRIREGASLDDLGLPSAVQFARELKVKSPRTIQRLIRKMIDRYALPIEFDYRRHGYHYTEDVVFSPFLQLSESELVAVYLSQQLAAFEGTAFRPRLKSAFRKTLGLFGGKMSFDPALLDECFSFDADGPHARFRPEHLDACARAMLRQEELVLNYTKQHGEGAGVPEIRRVRPLHITYRDFAYYALCQDLNRPDPRLFMVTRMNSVEETRVKFARPKGFDARKYLETAFKVFASQEAVAVTLRFARSATKRVLERKWHSTQQFAKLPEGGLEMKLRVGLAPDLVSWVASFLNECHVMEPDELRRQMAKEVGELARAYGWEVGARAVG